MRQLLIAFSAASFLASAASAQPTPAQSGPQNPALKSTDQNNSAAPVTGANSFTVSQAKARIVAAGFSNVKGLKKDANGVWRGTATKNGQPRPVSVDYQSNVN